MCYEEAVVSRSGPEEKGEKPPREVWKRVGVRLTISSSGNLDPMLFPCILTYPP